MSRRGLLAASVITLIVAALALAKESGGAGVGGSRHATIGMAELTTVYVPATAEKEETALLHVLFVPAVDEPEAASIGVPFAAGGTAARYELEYSLHMGWDTHELEIDARPVVIHDRKSVEADGQLFDLARGNVFLVHVNLDGTLLPIQLPHTFSGKATTVGTVLSAIQAAVPNDPRVQALDDAA